MNEQQSELQTCWYVATSFEWAVHLRGVQATTDLVSLLLGVADRTFGSLMAANTYYALNNVLVVFFTNEYCAVNWKSSLDKAIDIFLDNPELGSFPLDLSLN